MRDQICDLYGQSLPAASCQEGTPKAVTLVNLVDSVLKDSRPHDAKGAPNPSDISHESLLPNGQRINGSNIVQRAYPSPVRKLYKWGRMRITSCIKALSVLSLT